MAGRKTRSNDAKNTSVEDDSERSYLEDSQNSPRNSSASTLQLDVEGDASPRSVPRSRLHARDSRSGTQSPGSPNMSQSNTRHKSSPNTSGSKLQAATRTQRRDNQDFNQYKPSGGLYPDLDEMKASTLRVPSPSAARVKPRRKHSEEQTGGFIDDYWNSICGLCIIIFALAIYIFVIQPLRSSAAGSGGQAEVAEEEVSNRELMVEHFDQDIRSLQELFPEQDSRFWRVVRASIKRVLREEDPPQPAVVMLASLPHGSATMDCLANKFAAIIKDTYQAAAGPTVYAPDINSSSKRSRGQMKIEVDDRLSNGFSGGSKVAVVKHLERIPGKAAMMFHAYCDNENAPFKDVAILFTTYWNPSDLHGSHVTLKDSDVEVRLTDLWGMDLEMDSLTALLSRIANNVAVVRQEDSDTLQEAGCP